MEWRKCKHCEKDRYCTEQAMFEHQEDCPMRPSQRSKMKICPKCGSVLVRYAGEHWVCANVACDYELGMINGGKLQ